MQLRFAPAQLHCVQGACKDLLFFRTHMIKLIYDTIDKNLIKFATSAMSQGRSQNRVRAERSVAPSHCPTRFTRDTAFIARTYPSSADASACSRLRVLGFIIQGSGFTPALPKPAPAPGTISESLLTIAV